MTDNRETERDSDRETEVETDGWSRFSPREMKDPPVLELNRAPTVAGTEIGDVNLRKIKRKRLRMRVPGTFSWTGFFLAIVGAGTVFVFLVKGMKESAPEIMQAALDIDIEALLAEKPEPYVPPQVIVDGVLITLDVTPHDAHIYLDGKSVQSNPVRVKRGNSPLNFIVWEVGYLPAKAKVVPDEDTTVTLRLQQEPSGKKKKPAAAQTPK